MDAETVRRRGWRASGAQMERLPRLRRRPDGRAAGRQPRLDGADVARSTSCATSASTSPSTQMLARRSRSAPGWRPAGCPSPSSATCCCSPTTTSSCTAGYGCRLQIGGNDQWGNITAGLDLIRRVEGVEARPRPTRSPLPLVTDSTAARSSARAPAAATSGSTPRMTSPYALYQYLLNVDDRDVGTYLRLLTFLPREEVEALDAATAERPQARAAQRAARRGARDGSCTAPQELRARAGGQRGAVRRGSAGGARRAHAGRGARRGAVLDDRVRRRCPRSSTCSPAALGAVEVRRPPRRRGGRRPPQQRARSPTRRPSRRTATGCTAGSWCCAAARRAWPSSSAAPDGGSAWLAAGVQAAA